MSDNSDRLATMRLQVDSRIACRAKGTELGPETTNSWPLGIQDIIWRLSKTLLKITIWVRNGVDQEIIWAR
jgi:hypothetical protein